MVLIMDNLEEGLKSLTAWFLTKKHSPQCPVVSFIGILLTFKAGCLNPALPLGEETFLPGKATDTGE